jgi:hypothetical protein
MMYLIKLLIKLVVLSFGGRDSDGENNYCSKAERYKKSSVTGDFFYKMFLIPFLPEELNLGSPMVGILIT